MRRYEARYRRGVGWFVYDLVTRGAQFAGPARGDAERAIRANQEADKRGLEPKR